MLASAKLISMAVAGNPGFEVALRRARNAGYSLRVQCLSQEKECFIHDRSASASPHRQRRAACGCRPDDGMADQTPGGQQPAQHQPAIWSGVGD